MDFLLASLAPTVLPGLQRSLEMAFLAGLVTSKKLKVAQTPVAKLHGLPTLPQRQRQGSLQHIQQGSSRDRPRAPPNDPERKGNIWHRYEDLERRTRQLTSANQAMFAENARHQRTRRQLEEALLELDAACNSASGTKHSISPESTALLAELRKRLRRPHSPQHSLQAAAEPTAPSSEAETSDGRAELEGLRAELATAQEAAQAAEQEAAYLRGRLAAVQEELRGQAACAAAQLQGAKAAQAALENTIGAQDSAAAQRKQQVAELEGRSQDLEEEKQQLRAEVRSFQAAAARATDAALVRSLDVQNRQLAARNAQLEAAAAEASLGGRGNAAARATSELEQAHATLAAENARLQAAMMRLTRDAPAVAAAGELLEALKAENAQLQADNERFLAHIEALESANREAHKEAPQKETSALQSKALQRQHSAAAAEARTADGSIGNLALINQLAQENGLLEQGCARLAASLAASAKGTDKAVLCDVLAVNERLQQDKAQALSRTVEMATTISRLTEESEAKKLQRIGDRMATLVRDLQAENQQLTADNQRVNGALEKVLASNADLGTRLIDAALASGAKEAAEGGENCSRPQRAAGEKLASLPLGRWTQAEAQQRRSEAAAELAAVEVQQAARSQHHDELSSRATSELKAYEKHKRSAELAYSKAKALGLARLQSRNAQLAAGPGSAGRPGQSPRLSASAGSDGGAVDEAEHRRQQVEVVRAQLQAKVDAAVQKQRSNELSEQEPDQAGSGGPAAQAKAAQGSDPSRREAEDRVRSAFFRFAGNQDVVSYMGALGFEMPRGISQQGSPHGLIRAAMQVLQRAAQKGASQQERLLAEAAQRNLQQWTALQTPA